MLRNCNANEAQPQQLPKNLKNNKKINIGNPSKKRVTAKCVTIDLFQENQPQKRANLFVFSLYQ